MNDVKNDQINLFNENDKNFSKILEIKKYETILEIFEKSKNEIINDIFLFFFSKKNKWIYYPKGN